MFTLYTRLMAYFAKHEMLNSFAHVLDGFGLAILLQHYIQGNAFVSPLLGWFFIAVSMIIHVRAIMKGGATGMF